MSQAICILHIGFIFWAISDGYGRPLDSPELKIHLVGKVKLLKISNQRNCTMRHLRALLSSTRFSVKGEQENEESNELERENEYEHERLCSAKPQYFLLSPVF